MRRSRVLFLGLVLVLAGGLMLAAVPASAQVAPPPAPAELAIHSVSVQPILGALTIVGRGFGAAPLVTVDGERVDLLPGGTDTRGLAADGLQAGGGKKQADGECGGPAAAGPLVDS